LQRAQVRARQTFDSSRTPRAGETRAEPEGSATINLDELGTKIQATVERVKADDPRELKRQITALRRELASKPRGETVEVARVVEKRVEIPIEVPAISDEQVAELRETANTMRDLSRALAARADQIEEALRHVRESGAPRAHRAVLRARPEPRRQPREAPEADGSFAPSTSQQRILNALASLEAIGVEEAPKVQLALFSHASPKSSGYTNNLGALRTAGLIDYPRGGVVVLTEAGREIADAGDAPDTVDELHGYVFALVGASRTRILRVLIEAYPESLGKEELAEAADASPRSSGYTNNLGSLRSLGLIDYPSRGYVAALPVLFLEGALA